MDEWTIKTPNPICQLFSKIDLLTDIAALCLTDFIDWRYIHSVVCIVYPACELLPPWTKEQYLCTVVYCCPSTLPSLWPPPPSQTTVNVLYIQTVCVTGGGAGGGWGDVELSCRPYSARSFTLCFWPDSEPTKLLHHPKQMARKADIKGWCL